jgi:hypothetical protein
MTPAFQPKGERAQWELIYNYLERRNPEIGDIIEYGELEEVCGFDIRKNRQAFYRGSNPWCAEHHRAFACVAGVGYRVAHSTEHETLARKHHRKSRRALKKGLTVIRNTDYTELSPADQARFRKIETEISRQSDVIRRIDIRQDRMEKVLEEGRRAQEATRQQQQALNEKVERLEESLRRRGIEP